MTPRQVGITVDCADADQLAAFWERFLGYTRRSAAPGSPYVTIDRGDDGPDGPPFLTFQTVPEPKETKVRLHLDLFVDRARPYVEEMMAAGASSVSRTEAGEWTTRVFQDPAGNEFCVMCPLEARRHFACKVPRPPCREPAPPRRELARRSSTSP